MSKIVSVALLVGGGVLLIVDINTGTSLCHKAYTRNQR
jgi:hypothetical protein